MKIGVIGDCHFGVKSASLPYINFMLKWFHKTFSELASQGIHNVIQVGDFMDNRTTLDIRLLNMLSNEFLALLEEFNITFYSLVGNHNLYFRNANTYNNIDFLARMSKRFVVIDKPTMVLGNLVIPWINANSKNEIDEAIQSTNADYLFGHLELVNFEMYKGVNAVHGMDAAYFKKFKRVITGHYHTISSAGNINYTGSPYHLTWADYVDGVNRGYFIFDMEANEFKLVNNLVTDTLFHIHRYNPEDKEPDLSLFEGRNVVVVVDDDSNTKALDKFKAKVSGIPMLSYSITNNSIVAMKATKRQSDEVSKNVIDYDMIKVCNDYIVEPATARGVSVDVVSSYVSDLFQESLNNE